MRQYTSKLVILSGLLITLLFISGCSGYYNHTKQGQDVSQRNNSDLNEIKDIHDLVISFIDVGQGDSILIELSTGENILIDAGESDKGDEVLNYLKSRHVEQIDYLIATHPHSDHIGGMPAIIKNLGIGMIYMPRVSHTSPAYEKLLLSIKEKGLNITEAKAGVSLCTNELYNASFIAPNSSKYESINDYSAVLRLQYKEYTFLFTGDAELESGEEILDTGYNIKADVLKVPHHGSSSSCLTPNFLKAVSPKIAVISVGEDNSYGHPHKEILEMLEDAGVNVLRTDVNGTIIVVSNGYKLTITPPINGQKNQDKENKVYIGNKNSKVFHLPSCKNLPAEHNQVYFTTRQEALNNGFKPCSNCKP